MIFLQSGENNVVPEFSDEDLQPKNLLNNVLSQITLIYFLQIYLKSILKNCTTSQCWGHTVGKLVEALRYKLENFGFDSR